MPALAPQYVTILKQLLTTRFMPFLPPLLGNTNSNPADKAAKQPSRAFSTFAHHKLLDITAATSVVDDLWELV